jgi:alcohol dehydrogenase class IV
MELSTRSFQQGSELTRNSTLNMLDLMESFTYNVSPSRVVFGSGKLNTIFDEISRQNPVASLLLYTPEQILPAELLKTNLGGRVAGMFTEATMHTPTNITEKAVKYVESVKADSIVSIGGDSTVGLGKVIFT